MQQDSAAQTKDVEMEEKAAEGTAMEGAAAGAAEQDTSANEPKEKEQDAPEDKRAKLAADDVVVNTADSTLNVLPTVGGKLLMALSDGGFQYLLAGARASFGVKTGRYLFEVKVIEALNPGWKQQQPQQVVRIGLSTAGSCLFLGEGKDNVCFDTEGYYIHDTNWRKMMARIGHGQTLGLLLNMNADSPNANTVSLFCDGARVTEPQPLPENLVGKPLFPTVTYRNVTLQVNFKTVLAPLPFKCRTLGDAAKDDVEKAALLPKKAGEKAEVFFPVGLPEQGFFDYVDQFLAKHPDCTELSDRMLADWVAKSGYGKPGAVCGTSDQPELRTGVSALDDLSIRKILHAIAPTIRRNFVVTELKANLVGKERTKALLGFSAADFKKTALVLMGQPSAEYTEKVHAHLLAEKTVKVEEEKRKEAQQAEYKRAMEERKQKAAVARKAREAPKATEDAEEKKEGDAEDKEKEAKDDGEKKEEEKEEKKEEEEEKKEEKKEDEPIQLTEEEKKTVHRKRNLPDMADRVLSKTFADFSLPSKTEGFDGVSYVWQKEDESAKLMKSYVLEKKLTQRAEDLQPGEWFKTEWPKWGSLLQDWRKAQAEFKDPFKRKAMLAKKKEEAEKEGGAPQEESMEIDASSIEPADVKDVTDLGNGEPLFAQFAYEDWSLLSIRYEFHALLHAFKEDLNDSDRPSFTEAHLAFYYNRYFKKVFNLKAFGVEKFADFVEFIKDTVEVDEASGFLKTKLPKEEPMANFVKFAEDHRRERQMLVDAGDETAKLKFTRQAPPPVPRQQQEEKGGKGHDKRGGYGGGGGGGGDGYKRQYQPGPSSYQGGDSKQPRQTYGGGGGYGGGYSRR